MNELPQAPNLTDHAERTEEVVARVMRATRDEKIKLDTQVAELQQRVQQLDNLLHDLTTVYREDLAKHLTDRDRWQQRAVQLETEFRSLVAAANDALNTKPSSRSDDDPIPGFLRDRPPSAQD